MAKPLPPLNSLRAFEAAARHLSFSKGAEELAVTPAAISHQIKALEDHLGVRLFHRRQRNVALTEAGLLLAPGLARGFAELQAALALLHDGKQTKALVVSAAPAFASMWLVPRLPRFQERHPGYEVRLDASSGLTDFFRGDVDVGIRYGRGVYPGLRSVLLLPHNVTPVCAPALLERLPLVTVADLRRHQLLHVEWRDLDDVLPNWGIWLAAAGARDIDSRKGMRFNDSGLAVEAAMAGQGVALVNKALFADHLADGRLVAPFDVDVGSGGDFAFYIVAPDIAWDTPKLEAFRGWLLDEAGTGP